MSFKDNQEFFLINVKNINISSRYRVLKWWRHKNEISEIIGFVRIFWKNNVQRGLLFKNEHFGANFLWVMLRKLHINPNKFFWVDPKKKIRRVCVEFSEYNRLTSQRQFAPKCSFLKSRPLGHCSFRISWQIPQFQKFHFYDFITLVLYCDNTADISRRLDPVSSRNDVWETIAEIPYWWRVSTQIGIGLLIGWSKVPSNKKHYLDL